MIKNTILTEDEECYKLVKMLDIFWVTYSHLAQSTFTRSFSVKARNKKLGVRPWVPDYMIIRPFTQYDEPELIFIEMKRKKWWVVSKHQKKRIESLNETWTPTFVCKWFEAVCEVLLSFTVWKMTDDWKVNTMWVYNYLDNVVSKYKAI